MRRQKKHTRAEYLSQLQGEVFLIWRQLEALGFLLDRQGDAVEGVPELQGLGLGLGELAIRLEKVWRDLDIPGIDEISNN